MTKSKKSADSGGFRTYSVHRQLTPAVVIAPATIGDISGPPATAMEYAASAVARSAGEKMSPRTPPVFVTGAELKKPAKKRVMKMAERSLDAAVAKVKHAPIKYGGKTATLRPYISLIGAHSKGPVLAELACIAVNVRDFVIPEAEEEERNPQC